MEGFVDNDNGDFEAGVGQKHNETIKLLIPSPNKWDCFSINDNRKRSPAKIITSQVVRKAYVMTSTSSINSKTIPTTGRYSPSEERLSRNNSTESGYRRLTLREKLAKQRLQNSSHDNNVSPDDDTTSLGGAASKRSRFSKSKTKSFDSSSTTKSDENEPGASASSNVTKDKKVFGFKVMKGTTTSSSIGTRTNDQQLSSYGGSSSMREPRQSSRGNGKSETNLFYMPKTVDKTSKSDISNRQYEKKEELNCSADRKDKTKKSVTRAESLQEGKTRLQEFREKQRREKLSRAATVVEKERDRLPNKNISESLAEIRERIRERRRKKEELRKSQSLPERETVPMSNEKDESKLSAGKVSPRYQNERKDDAEETFVKRRTKRDDKDVGQKRASLAIPESDDDLELDEKKKEIPAEVTPKKKEYVALAKEEKKSSVEIQPVTTEDKSEKGESLHHSNQRETKYVVKPSTKQDASEVGAQPKDKFGYKVTSPGSKEDGKTDQKKRTREKRRLERYQRSKTMSDIMYSDISSSAARETEHKSVSFECDTVDQTSNIGAFSDIKKRFSENESGKLPEPGLFYSKSSKKKSDDKKVDKANNLEYVSLPNKKERPRRHTLHGMTGNYLVKDVTSQDELSSDDTKEEHDLVKYTDVKQGQRSSSEGILRRHTFNDNSKNSRNLRSPLRAAESVEKLKEKFSGGSSSLSEQNSKSHFLRRASSLKEDKRQDTEKEEDSEISSLKRASSLREENRVDKEENVYERRRVKSDSVEKPKSVAEAYITLTPPTKRAPLSRRHTTGNTSMNNSQEDGEKRQENRDLFHEKYLSRGEGGQSEEPSKTHEEDISIKTESTSFVSKNKDGRKSKDVKPSLKKNEEEAKEKKTKKGEKNSVSKLRQLFLGKPASTEKKTKLKDRRAKTIAGITPEIYKEIEVKKNKAEDKPCVDKNLAERKPENTSKKSERKHSGSRSKSEKSEQGTPKPAIDLQADISKKPKEKLPDVTFTSATKGGRLPDVLVSPAHDAVFHDDDTSDDKYSLKSSIHISEPELSKTSGAPKQSLDDFLTSIENIAGSPKTQRKLSNLSLGSSQKLSVNLSRDEEDIEKNRQLSVANTNLTQNHSWSTSDLDKLFYGGKTTQISHVVSEMELSDFDEISNNITRLPSLTESRTKIRPKRNVSKSANPLKSLLERTDIRTNTEEPVENKEANSGFEKVKKRSVPRKKRSQIEPWRRHTLDPVALAALASREDFSRVSLRKTKGPGKEKGEFDGSLPVMLLQIKGRRQVQTRLVEPKQSSLNSGDCFILVTPKELFCWIGRKANTIEKAKAVEISSKIQKRGDMNCKTGDVLYIDEAKQANTLAYKKFCKILEGDPENAIQDSSLCPDDEFYEREIISTNKIFKLQEGDPPHLIPVLELTGHMPRFNVLNTKEVFVFDFGSEVYLWTGQHSLSGKRKVAFHLALMVHKQKFITDAVVNPIDPNKTLKRIQGGDHVYYDAEGKECGRPLWTMFARLHEKAETILFQEKFFDWPDPTKIIKMKGHVSSGEVYERGPREELQPCDVVVMQKHAKPLEPVKLEETNLGRGLGTPNVEVDGVFHEGDLVTTLGMTVWLVTQKKHFVLPKESEGHFHSGEGYVIRWVYFVAKNRVVKNKRGRIRPLTGRQRCAYFFWQGNECSVNEKGAAAIMAVELDEERGPQIRVVEGKEPPHFLKLFDGGMIIHLGKRVRSANDDDDTSDKSTVRMYCVRNEDTSEGCLIQVRKSSSSLRSRSSFVVVDSEHGNIFLWHGCKSNEYHRKVAEKAANFIKERKPSEVHLCEKTSVVFTEVEEGQEPEVFWKTLGGRKSGYISLIKDPLNYDFSPRLFHFSSALGQFIATEILCPSRYPSRTCPFPVFQDDLYTVSQPAMFLLDVGDELYIWEGWLPPEVTKDKKGSAKRRWDEERKLTLQTALAYVKQANNRIKKGAFVVHAGLEPLSFTTHFPFWEKKQNITEMKIKEGRQENEKRIAKDVLDTFSKKYYSLQELTNDNPPDGIDLSKMETYLNDDEFERLFEMKRDLFAQLPGWKQDILKKALGLF